VPPSVVIVKPFEKKNEVPRMGEALELFTEVVNAPYFNDSSIILFLNKVDIFITKLREIPLSTFFPEYAGDDTNENACEFVKARFTEKASDSNRVFVHITCALDTDHIEKIIYDVRRVILDIHMKDITPLGN